MAPDSYDFLLIFSVATIGMLMLAGVIITFMVFYQRKMIKEQMKRQALEFEYQQKMMQAELESQEGERRKLAADLHDSIGGMLSTIRVGISALGKTHPDTKNVDQAKQMLDDTISSVRRISRDLLPVTLEKFGFQFAVREMCERFQGASGIQVECHQQADLPSFDKQRELMLYRIVQELLNNAVKHSAASVITVHLKAENGIQVAVEDNGVGFDFEEMVNNSTSGKGLGLFNIKNRVRLLGGRVESGKDGIKGSKTIVTIPITHEKEKA